LTAIFKSCIPQTRKDRVIIYVSASSDGHDDELTYYKIFKPTNIHGRYFSAIEYTTAIGLISMVDLYLNNKLPENGYVKQEQADWKDALKTTYGSYYRE
jgi:saccharopine dehydrogenase-like NADP-dependent oxidoreductase